MTIHRRTRNPAFTLIELLIVLAILVILVSLVVAVAAKVTQGGKASYTQNMIQMLDQAYGAWSLDKGQKAPRHFTDDEGTQFPIVDGRGYSSSVLADPEPSLALALFAISENASSQSIIRGIDPKLVKQGEVLSPRLAAESLTDGKVKKSIAGGTGYEARPDGLTINDAWGRPMRFVVPAYHGGFGEYYDPTQSVVIPASSRPRLSVKMTFQGKTNPVSRTLEYRRSYRPDSTTGQTTGDADEGLCAGATPYFYSAGPDGDPGTRGDNVYSQKPAFPPETAKFNAN